MRNKINKVEAEFSIISLIKELARKSIHISACGVALFLVGNEYLVLELLFLPLMALAFYVVTEKIDVLGKTLSFGSRRKWGGILLAFGLSLVMFVPIDYEIKKFAILILMIADVAAAIIGKLIPIKKVEVLGAYKSIGGCLAFAIGVVIVLLLSFGTLGAWWQALVTIAVLTCAEFLNWRGIDNITLPACAILLGLGFFG